MEFAKQLLNKHTKLGRAVRTGLQVVLAVLTAALGLLAVPGLEKQLFDLGFLPSMGLFATWSGAISYAWNAAEGLYKAFYADDETAEVK